MRTSEILRSCPLEAGHLINKSIEESTSRHPHERHPLMEAAGLLQRVKACVDLYIQGEAAIVAAGSGNPEAPEGRDLAGRLKIARIEAEEFNEELGKLHRLRKAGL